MTSQIMELKEIQDELCALLGVPNPDADAVVRMVKEHRVRREKIMKAIYSGR